MIDGPHSRKLPIFDPCKQVNPIRRLLNAEAVMISELAGEPEKVTLRTFGMTQTQVKQKLIFAIFIYVAPGNE
jgi:hypothetical protein